MKSKALIGFICCLFLYGSVACLSDRLLLTEENAGKTHSFKKGEVFRIALQGASPTMLWSLGSFDKSILESKGAKWKQSEASSGGLQPGIHTYAFKAKKVGKTTVVLYQTSGVLEYEAAKKMDGFYEKKFDIVVMDELPWWSSIEVPISSHAQDCSVFSSCTILLS